MWRSTSLSDFLERKPELSFLIRKTERRRPLKAFLSTLGLWVCAIHHCLHSTLIFLRKPTLLKALDACPEPFSPPCNSINHHTLLSIHLKILVLWHPKPNCGHWSNFHSVGPYFSKSGPPYPKIILCVPCVPLSLFWCIFYVEKWNFLHKQREKGKIKVYFTWNDFPSFFLSFFERYVSSLTNWATWEDLQNYRNFSDKIYVHCNLFPRVDELCFTILVTFFTSFPQLEAIRKALRHFFYVMFYLFYFILDVSDATKLNINSKASFLRHTQSLLNTNCF